MNIIGRRSFVKEARHYDAELIATRHTNMMHPSFWTLLMQVSRPTAWQRMDSDTRGRVFLMLCAIAGLGFLLICIVWIAGRWTRYYVARGSVASEPSRAVSDPDDWAKKPLHSSTKDDSDDAEPR